MSGRLRRWRAPRPNRLTSWLTVVALSVAGATAGLVMSVDAATVAGADPIGDCSTTTGVIVAVDFTAWGGDVERGCDARITTGYHALHAAGFTTAGDDQDGPGFICRIDEEPSAAQESCVTTPPPDASWSYWHADVGQDAWTYSQLGAMSYHPPPGSVDAWTFGSTDIGPDGQPTFPPSSVRATNGSGTTTTEVTTTVPASTTPTSTDPPRSPGPSTAGTGQGPPTTTGTPSPPTTGAGTAGAGQRPVSSALGPAPTTTATTTSGGTGPVRSGGRRAIPKIVDAVPVATDRQAAGSPVPLLAGAGVVVALAGAAGAVAWRRRRIG